MKIIDLANLISDVKLGIEIIEQESGASFGIYNKVTIPDTEFKDKEIKNINAQYCDLKRILVVKF